MTGIQMLLVSLHLLFLGAGMVLLIGVARQWRWLVDPPAALWPVWGLSLVNRLFGSLGVRITVVVIGAACILIGLQGIRVLLAVISGMQE